MLCHCKDNVFRLFADVIFWICGVLPGRNRLDFGGNPDSFADPGSFSRMLTISR